MKIEAPSTNRISWFVYCPVTGQSWTFRRERDADEAADICVEVTGFRPEPARVAE